LLRFGCSTVRLTAFAKATPVKKPDTAIVTLVVEKYWRRREISTEFADFLRKIGGGGGSRTRVREYFPVGLYMRVRFWVLMSSVTKRRKTAGHQTR
jgi:hypothetical protein